MNPGKFIVIEGLEGAGKSTVIETIFTILQQQGIQEIIKTREPGGTPIAEKLRDVLKAPALEECFTAQTEILLLYAARIQLVENVIKPALVRGAWVIGDRHSLSSLAYQGAGRGIDSNFIDVLQKATLGTFQPDLTFYLDIPPMLGLARARARGKLDRIEQESLDFFERVRQCYLKLAAANPSIQTIDASRALAEVNQDITMRLEHWLTK